MAPDRSCSHDHDTHQAPPSDPVQLGKLIVEISTGQVVDAQDDSKDAAAAELGRKGGAARAAKLSPEQNFTSERKGEFGIGDVWTWTAIDADTKLVPSWLLGDRSASTAKLFMANLASRLSNRVQLTSDGHKTYLEAVEETFGADVDYAQLVKLYGDTTESQKRYSPAECTGCKREAVTGRPDPAHISTSFAERQNLTMRMGMRRFTRPTNDFSKDAENHARSIALHFMHYNFVRIHQTLRVTPAMVVGITGKLWELADVVAMIDAAAPEPAKRGPYKKRAS
ncbi:MAG: hypothetical protein WAS21_21075 [Geminicoccaceae bacterium]